MQNNKLIQDLTTGDIRRKLILFSIPFMLSNLMQALYNVVDMIVVGHYIGSAGLSAVSMGSLLCTIMLEFGIGLSGGGQIFIAQLVGAKQNSRLNSAIWTLFFLITVTSVIIGGAGFFLDRFLLNLLNTPAEAVEHAAGYLRCCCLGMFFLYGYNAVSAVLRGMGNSSKPMLFVFIATLVNVVLDILFVAVFRMGVFGAALATVIAQGIAFIFSLAYLIRMRHAIGLSVDTPAALFSWENAGIIARLGLPLTFMQIVIKGSMLFINSYINLFGVSASAVVGVGDKLYSVVSIVSGAMCAAVASTVAQNMGAGRTDRARQAVLTAFAVTASFVLILTFLALLFPEAVFGIFTTDPEVLSLAPRYLRISVIMYWCFALMCPPMGLINGVGNTMLNSLIGILDSVVARIGLSLLLGISCGMGLWGFVLGSSLAGIVSVLISCGYFLSGKWKTRNILAHNT